jgi:hypothetical protein
MFAVILIHKK